MIVAKYSVMEFAKVFKQVVFAFGLEAGDGREVLGQVIFFS